MKRLLWLFCMIICLMVIDFSCERKTTDEGINAEENSGVLIQEAQTYFQTLTSQRARISVYNSSLPKKWLDNREPQWGQAVTFKKAGKSIVEVPLLYDSKEPIYTINSKALNSKGNISQQNGVTKVLFFKHQNGTIAAYIMRLILDPTYLAKTKKENRYKSLSFSTLSKDFTGIMLLFSWQEKLLDLYQFDQGKIVARNRPVTAGNKNARISQCYYNPRCENVCVGYSPSCCTYEEEAYNPTGNCCGERSQTCYYQCIYDEVCYPDQEPTEPGSPGDNPTDPGDNSATTADITVDPNLNPCFKNIINSVTADRYKAYLLKRAREVFGNNGGTTNLTFKGGPAGGSLGGYSPDDETIYLDASKLTNQSNEWVATVLFHEITHAIIVEFRGSFLTPSTYDQHKEMFAAWVNNMKDALKEVYPNLTDTEALSLALQGMDDYIRDQNNNIRPEVERAAQEKFHISLAAAAANAAPYNSGAMGTRCNQ